MVKNIDDKMKDYTTRQAERLTRKLIRASGKKVSKETKAKIIELLKKDIEQQMIKRYKIKPFAT